jgi:hypothetical protein
MDQEPCYEAEFFRRSQARIDPFLFEKKNQKTFANSSVVYLEKPKPKESKVFCFFFEKSRPSLLCLAATRRGTTATTAQKEREKRGSYLF